MEFSTRKNTRARAHATMECVVLDNATNFDASLRLFSRADISFLFAEKC